MNNKNRSKVKRWLKLVNTDPLYFNRENPDQFLKLSIDDLVLKILNKMENGGSYNSTLFMVTYFSCYRSVLDIWRHIKKYKPRISIFTVMHSMYKQQKNLGGQYCSSVKRRTFFYSPYPNVHSISNKEISDEFGLLFEDWKDI